jgi:hypothetical protein
VARAAAAPELGLAERPNPLHPLVRPEPLERFSEGRPVGQSQVRVQLEQRSEHEPTRGHLEVREGEPIRAQLDLPEQEQIYVDRPRPVPGAAEGAPVLGLYRLAEVEQGLRLERRPDPDGSVEEIRLVEDLPNRLGLI